MDKSLDEIISSRGGWTNNSRSSLKASSNNSRRSRQVTPYGDGKERGDKRPSPPSYEAALKILLPNYYVSAMIGSGGSNMKDMWDLTGASIHVSDANLLYPGTHDRVIYIFGGLKEVNYAQSLLWELIGFCDFYSSEEVKRESWSVRHVVEGGSGRFDDVEVTAKVIVPSHMGGHIVGRGGAALLYFATESGAKIQINDKAEADELQTQERMIKVSGTVASCMKCTSLILNRLAGQEDGCAYRYHGTAYPKRLLQQQQQQPAIQSVGKSRGLSSGDMDLNLLSGPSNSKASSLIRAEVLSANTTIEIAVQDQDIGALLGLQGAKLNEMMTLSGAKIIVSKRGEFIEGTNNRLVTIIGSPANAQTAHTLVLNTLRQLELEDK